ncbi:Rpr2-domain-containing protein [Aaosphaeria arxii CBS 175.79]|uniref:Rpr2-domain-containing protein n=1 Tax=Aaosphaeria arxii CBS 175.79 TaxID=1450172 RepID=A0A6A5XVA4_9PLEO|nr:Rpr2-domain-containing protein [Aaosphaeria arxii CBS 175.79]KAF2017248.1 Rpr2-domain-containing protein [Aaosphaeria arxii CBS 175.79]
MSLLLIVCLNKDPSLSPARISSIERQTSSPVASLDMVKAKGIPNKHLHARASFLYQAATYLSLQRTTESSLSERDDPSTAVDTRNPFNDNAVSKPALVLASHLRAVTLKGQIRLAADLKRTICKTCSAILIPGQTSTHSLENESTRGEKPWADVLKITCNACSSTKRYPIGTTKRQNKAGRRNAHRRKSNPRTPVYDEREASSDTRSRPGKVKTLSAA